MNATQITWKRNHSNLGTSQYTGKVEDSKDYFVTTKVGSRWELWCAGEYFGKFATLTAAKTTAQAKVDEARKPEEVKIDRRSIGQRTLDFSTLIIAFQARGAQYPDWLVPTGAIAVDAGVPAARSLARCVALGWLDEHFRVTVAGAAHVAQHRETLSS